MQNDRPHKSILLQRSFIVLNDNRTELHDSLKLFKLRRSHKPLRVVSRSQFGVAYGVATPLSAEVAVHGADVSFINKATKPPVNPLE